MKKESITSFIVNIILLAIGLVFALVVLRGRPVDTNFGGAAYYGIVIAAVAVGFVLNALIFEFGHLIGAKAGRYEVLSFNVLWFCFYKAEGKLKFKFQGFDGVSGETKILPKTDAKKEPNPTLFLTLGNMLFVVEAIILFTLFVIYSKEGKAAATSDLRATYNDIAYFLLTAGFVGLLMFLFNIVPFKMEILNDGYRFALVSNPKNRYAFNELLRVEHEIELGNQDVEIKTFDQITNFTADLNLNKVYLLLNQEKYEDAEVLVRQIIDSKKDISNSVYIDALCQLIFITFMKMDKEAAIAEVNSYVTNELKRDIQSQNSMVAARAYILIEGLIDKSKSECAEEINDIKSAFKKTNKQRRPIEIKLFNIALDKVIDEHPNWGFEEFRLKEVEEEKSDKKKDK